MTLKKRHILVKLPEEQQVREVISPTVAPSRISQAQLEHIKRSLAKQNGYPRKQIEEEIAKRDHKATAPKSPSDESDEIWQAALWHEPT